MYKSNYNWAVIITLDSYSFLSMDRKSALMRKKNVTANFDFSSKMQFSHVFMVINLGRK